MSNGVRGRILPHLTPEEISDRDHQELRLNRELSRCWRGDNFDAERAFQVLRAYAVEIFDVVYPAFQKKTGYEQTWTADIVGDTVFRALTVYNGHTVYGMPSVGELSKTLEATLLDHLKELKTANPQAALRTPVALTGKQASAYAAAGIDLASASPLLLMAHEQANRSAEPSPKPNQRKVYVLPILETKGWSILDWANEAEVAYHTAADYLDGKTRPYRSSRLKMAKALGVTVQQLPR
jgi:lambda repressor-like predicted transcriptional regulator